MQQQQMIFPTVSLVLLVACWPALCCLVHFKEAGTIRKVSGRLEECGTARLTYLVITVFTWLQASDNTRQAQTASGESWLLPAHETRRVILCSGQIYYTLSRARKSRQISDVILVRLEQIAPFPHDLVTQVCHTPVEHIMCQVDDIYHCSEKTVQAASQHSCCPAVSPLYLICWEHL